MGGGGGRGYCSTVQERELMVDQKCTGMANTMRCPEVWAETRPLDTSCPPDIIVHSMSTRRFMLIELAVTFEQRIYKMANYEGEKSEMSLLLK